MAVVAGIGRGRRRFPTQRDDPLEPRQLALRGLRPLDVRDDDPAILGMDAEVVQPEGRVVDRRHIAEPDRHAVQDLEPGAEIGNHPAIGLALEEGVVGMAEEIDRGLGMLGKDRARPVDIGLVRVRRRGSSPRRR